MITISSNAYRVLLSFACYSNMFPVTYKTVIVLDRSPYFQESSQQPVEFDMLVKTKVAGVIPLAPITKSLWTCNVEAVLEYVRVVYDLFPSNKLVCFICRAHNCCNCKHLLC